MALEGMGASPFCRAVVIYAWKTNVSAGDLPVAMHQGERWFNLEPTMCFYEWNIGMRNNEKQMIYEKAEWNLVKMEPEATITSGTLFSSEIEL
jgi:hypothetical protein